MSFPGITGGGGGVGTNKTGMSDQETAMVKAVSTLLRYIFVYSVADSLRSQMQGAMESCPFKTALSGGMGFALGGAFGLFMSSVRAIQAEVLLKRSC